MATLTQRVTQNARKRGLTVYTRGEWGSKHSGVYLWRRVSKRHKLLPKRPSDTLVQHITVTRDSGQRKGDFFTDMRTVERIGYERFKSGVSYNWVVDMTTGEIGTGMPLDAKGTHTVNLKGVKNFSYDQNAVAIAIAVLGMPGEHLSAAAEHALAHLIAAHIEEGALTRGHDYVPHALFAYKSCPTPQVIARMDDINKEAKLVL